MALLDRNISGRSRIMQPSQSPSDRMLTALVLHTVSTILSRKDDPLVQPFATILVNPQALKVGVYIMQEIALRLSPCSLHHNWCMVHDCLAQPM